MPRIFLVLVSLILMAALACGGGSGPRMTVEEYAEGCTSLGDRFEDLDRSADQGLGALEDALAEVKKWNPPEELQEFHNLQVMSLEFLLNALQETDLLQLMQDLEKASEGDAERFLELLGDMEELEGQMGELEAQMAELDEAVQRTEDDLSPSTREILSSAGCL